MPARARIGIAARQTVAVWALTRALSRGVESDPGAVGPRSTFQLLRVALMPAAPLLPLTRATRYPAPRAKQGGPRRGLTRRGPRCEAGLRDTATGIRTPVSAVRGRRPSPLDDGGLGAASLAAVFPPSG